MSIRFTPVPENSRLLLKGTWQVRFCPVKADILVIPESMQQKDCSGMPPGPDAIL